MKYYHGTKSCAFKNMQKKGIDVSYGSAGELGTGFYMTDSFTYACLRAYGKNKCKNIVLLHLEENELKAIKHTEYHVNNAKDLSDKIYLIRNMYCDLKCYLGYDIVRSKIVDDPMQIANQIKFESKLMENFLNNHYGILRK